MVYNIRKQTSLKLASILNDLLDSNVVKLSDKLANFLNFNRVDKNSKDFAVLSIDLNDLNELKKVKYVSLLLRLREQENKDFIETLSLNRNLKLSIRLKPDFFRNSVLRDIQLKRDVYGFDLDASEIYLKKIKNNREDCWLPKKQSINTVVEYSSPNIAKPLHAGHMRSTFLGNYLSNLHHKLGQNVTKVNYLGDWGTQYGILAVGFNKYGSMEELNKSPIKHLLDVYVKANSDDSLKGDALEYFSQMENGNAESLKTWELFKSLTIKELESVYKDLNIKFDVYESESEYYEKAKKIVDLLLSKKLARKLEDSAIECVIKKENLSTTISNKDLKYIIQKKDGSTLYITRDIAALLERKQKYDFAKIIYVVDSSQRDHFKKLYETVNAMDENFFKNLNFDDFYVPFGRLTNMSTRKGQVTFLKELINEAKGVALESMNSLKIKKSVENIDLVAQTIGNSHLIVTDLMRPRMKDYEFSWKNIVSKDDSAFMCHYCHARLHNLIEKSKQQLNLADDYSFNVDFNLLTQPIENVLVQHLSRFQQAVWQSYVESEPYHVVQYLFQLTRLTNICLSENYVIGENEKLALSRLALYSCCKIVMANSFRLLGIEPLNQV